MKTDAATSSELDSGPAATVAAADAAPELQALLTEYAATLAELDSGRAIRWFTLEKPRLVRWLRIPAFTRIVRAFYLRYVYRCVDALKCDESRASALDSNDAESTRDLECLLRFEQSLPRKRRLVLIWPLAVLGVLGVAYLLASTYRVDYQTLFGDLAFAAVNLNQVDAIEAVQSAHRLAVVGVSDEAKSFLFDIRFFSKAAALVAWAAFLVVLPLLSAHAHYRQLRTKSASLGTIGFASFGASGRETELDLVAFVLLMPAVAVYGYGKLLDSSAGNSLWGAVLAGMCALLIVAAGVEVWSRYAERRHAKKVRRGWITQGALWLTTVLSLGLLCSPLYVAHGSKDHEDRWPLTIVTSPPTGGDDHTTGWLFHEAYFIITGIRQHIDCDEPHGPLVGEPQYLQYDLETWSNVDKFVTPSIATALLLRNWSVLGTAGKPTVNLLLHTKCSQGTDAIAKPLVAGTHTKTSVVVTAPADAACLQLAAPNYHAVWVWPIPPASECKH